MNNGYVVCVDELKGCGSVPDLVVVDVFTKEGSDFQGETPEGDVIRAVARQHEGYGYSLDDIYVYPIGDRICVSSKEVTPPVKPIIEYNLEKL